MVDLAADQLADSVDFQRIVAGLVVLAAILLLAFMRRGYRASGAVTGSPSFGTLRVRDAGPWPAARSSFVAVCEFERFEAIRRNVGYSTANAIIAHAAAEIRRVLPDAEIGRTHRTSIEFASAGADPETVTASLWEVVNAFERTVHVEGCDFRLVPRVAFVLAVDQLNRHELIERAEVALHDRANAHRRIIDATLLDDAATARLGLLRDLHHAIESDALELYYQPKLRCRTEQVDSAEALLRWDHPSLGPIRPDDFIAMAEETGLIRRLTEWTLGRAVRDRQKLAEAGHPLTIYVNISGLLLPDRDFAAAALTLMAGTAEGIGFEITETAVIDHPEQAITNLRAFTAAGIKIAIDDYGSGLSSLAYLKQLPAHELKIDKLFISGLTSSHRDPLLVRSSIDLAHALEMEVTAEGVDNPMALSLLRVMGCDMIQGFLVAKPMALEPMIDFLNAGNHGERTACTKLPRFGTVATLS